MNFIGVSDISPAGETGARAALLAARLDGDQFAPEQVFSMSHDWPGDFPGRTILAQTLTARSTKKYPAYLDDIVTLLPRYFNERGYLGTVMPDGEFDEQQLSGHSWLLRGLCEYCMYRGDKSETVLEYIKNIVNNLFIPAQPHYADYPSLPSQRKADTGDMSGTVVNKVGAWHLSSDTCCAFIPIDGITAAFELTGDVRILMLAETMIELFSKIDLFSIKAQTHASLTAARGILRMFSFTKNRKYFDTAEKIFDLYINRGMTSAYQNYNWFGRPEWTEPCAVIDSFMVAMQLYTVTSNTKYIDYAQRILYNGIYRGQRPNGGFGCDSCAVDGLIKNHCYEAFWCCTMRGGEGLARAAQYSYIVDGNRIIVPYLASSEADIRVEGECVHIVQRTSYPYDGHAEFVISGIGAHSNLQLCIYRPGEGEFYTEELSPIKKHVSVNFTIPLIKASPAGSCGEEDIGSVYLHGNLLLGTKFGANPDSTPDFANIKYLGNGRYSAGEVILSPIGDLWKSEKTDAECDVRKIIFN